MLKKVLIITYYWPPAGGIGVVRWIKFVKYLRNFGWEPVVYTVTGKGYPLKDTSMNLTIIRRRIWEPFRLYQFFLKNKNESEKLDDIKWRSNATFSQNLSNWIRANLFIPDARAFWIKPSVRFLVNYLKTNPVDSIVSTGPPHSAHLIALGIKKRTGLNWLADFRDPWTTMDYYKELLLTKWANKKHHRLENEVLNEADVVTVVSNGMKTEFESKRGREVVIVTNGFDSDDFSGEKIELDQDFSIMHAGSFYSRVNPTGLWKALLELKEENHPMFSKLKIKLMGRVGADVIESIHAYGLHEFLILIPFQPRDEAVKQIRSAQVLLLCVLEQARFVLTGKLFEYLAAQRPILCIGPKEGDAAKIIRETSSGLSFSFDEVKSIKQYLVDLYIKFEKGDPFNNWNNVQNYSHKLLAKQIADLLNQSTNAHHLKS